MAVYLGITGTKVWKKAKNDDERITIVRRLIAGSERKQDAILSELREYLPDLDVDHNVMIERLKRWRHKTSAALGIPAYRVLTNATIDRIAESCPLTTEQLELVSGIGPATIEQFGYDIVELIKETIG